MFQDISQAYVILDSEDFKLQVKESKIPAIGEGLFAKKKFFQQQIIGQYRGPIIDSKYAYDQLYCEQDKMVWINNKYCVIGRSAVSKANDIVKFEPEKYRTAEYQQFKAKKQLPQHEGYQRNARIQFFPKDKVFLVATTQIKEGDQIFTSYGFQYWDFFLDRQAQKLQKI